MRKDRYTLRSNLIFCYFLSPSKLQNVFKARRTRTHNWILRIYVHACHCLFKASNLRAHHRPSEKKEMTPPVFPILFIKIVRTHDRCIGALHAVRWKYLMSCFSIGRQSKGEFVRWPFRNAQSLRSNSMMYVHRKTYIWRS